MSGAPPTPNRFVIIPENELDALQRDLRFHPATTANPTALSRTQLEAYNRDGYLKGLPLFSSEEITAHRTYFDALLARVMAGGGDSYSISTAHLRYGAIYDLITHPRIVPYIRDILGENVIGWGAHYFCKMPGDGKRVSWHQDASYWPMTPSKTVTLWLALDDANTENACMRFIPGSHHQGHLTWKLSEEDEHNVLNQTVENAEAFGEPVDVELQAGQISLHSDLLLHGSEANTSQRRRCGLTLRYCAAEVRAHMGWSGKGVIVSGVDPDGHWANPPRPAQD